MADLITTPEGFERGMAKAQFQRLLVLLVNHGVKAEEASKLCLGLAEMARTLEVLPALQPYADMTAQHYEDMANMMFGDGLLPRDPKS